jgi:peptide/nickel transport system permease protein
MSARRRATRAMVRGRRVVAGLSAAFLVTLCLGAVAAPWLDLPNPTAQQLAGRLAPPLSMGPHAVHWLGTDQLGRDVFSRVIWGARPSLTIAVLAVALAAAVGSSLGLLSGYRGGSVDGVVMRAAEVQLAFPFLLLALLLVAVLGRGVGTLVLAFAVSEWALFARTARAEALLVRVLPFVEAARGLGAPEWRIVIRHVLPNASSSAVVLATLALAKVMVAEASLSFLGLGVPAPTPSWGSIVSDGRGYLNSAWWISAFPGAVLLLTVLAANRIGDDLRDYLNPVLQREAAA